MKNKTLLLSLALMTLAPMAVGAQTEQKSNGVAFEGGYIRHPWHGKRVAYLGDSITDPRNNSKDIRRKYWGFLQEWLGIVPYVYGISGRQWNDVPRQAEQLKAEHGDSVDAIIVFIGTNDYNAGVPTGEWFTESEDTVTAGKRDNLKTYRRKRRLPVMSKDTYKGRINIAINRLKELYPNKQIVLLTPLHRAYAAFKSNIQPDESWQNSCGEYFSAYVDAVREAGSLWGVPVIDLNAVSGMNPMVEAQVPYFHRSDTDRLHPSTSGQERMARTLVYQLLTLPVW